MLNCRTRSKSWLLSNCWLLVISLFVVLNPHIFFFLLNLHRGAGATLNQINITRLLKALNFWTNFPVVLIASGCLRKGYWYQMRLLITLLFSQCQVEEGAGHLGEEMLTVKDILEWWVGKYKFHKAPLITLGASSGGYFVSARVAYPKLSSIMIMIAEGVFGEIDIPEDYPPTLFIHMPKDVHMKQQISVHLEMLKSKCINVA
ncbi:unnamed protein product [Linum tenue]|uniref:Uncharacterized protein n=1 Tax=Linum tenue TaxID=586396 RepID=A0AAV0NRY0_9ROSI|nr:unnamed protein product [Linum tenue]